LSAYVDVSRPSESIEERMITVSAPSSSLRLFVATGLLKPSRAIFVSAWGVAAIFDSIMSSCCAI
jgi:hypothetical protein